MLRPSVHKELPPPRAGFWEPREHNTDQRWCEDVRFSAADKDGFLEIGSVGRLQERLQLRMSISSWNLSPLIRRRGCDGSRDGTKRI